MAFHASRSVGVESQEGSRPLGSPRVLYLATHFPAVSHTFISDEVAYLRDSGIQVLTCSINGASADALKSERGRREGETTFYLKAQGASGAARSVVRALSRRPLRLLGCTWKLLRSDMFDLPRSSKRLAQVAEAVMLWDHCSRLDVRAIHAHFGGVPATVAWYTAEIGNALARNGEAELPWTWSVTIHGWHEFTSEGAAQLQAKLHSAAMVACISDFTHAQLKRIALPADWSKLHVVRCGIDPDRFPARAPLARPRDPVVIITARLSPEKGHIDLFEAVSLLNARGCRVRVRCIGDGPFVEALERAIAQHSLVDQIEMLGPLPPLEVERELAEADVFCLPSSAEGLPVAIMEAMAVGVPVVTTYISGIPELIRSGDTGWIVPAARPDLLAAAIEDILDDPETTADVVARARDAVLEQHDGRRNAEQLRALMDHYHSGA